MVRQTSAIKYNFRPEFPAAAVDRYPSLTCALGNNYPGLTAQVDERNAPIWPSSSVPVAGPTQPTLSWISPDEISPKRMGNNSIFGNDSFPELQDRYLQAHATNPSFGSEYFIPICTSSNGPAPAGDATSDRNFRSPVGPLSPLSYLPPAYLVAALGNNDPGVETVLVDGEQWNTSTSIWPPRSCVPDAQPPGTWTSPEDAFFFESTEESSHNILRDNYFPNPSDGSHSFILIGTSTEGLVDTMNNSGDLRSPSVGSPSLLPDSPINSLTEYHTRPERRLAKFDTTSDGDLRSNSVGSPSPTLDLPSISSVAAHSPRPERHSTKVRKSYDCLFCPESFTRSSDLRTHENTHTNKQRFACNIPNCMKKFGVRSNLQRHQQVAHNIRRTRKSRPVAEYEIKFEPPSPCPSLLSDATSTPSRVVWDNEGPFSRRSIA
ncbi:hypothetical protein K438DRAFT_1944301 [Mycena galopus ATCC 62051]|nr:hypothetical protein K438DRAFT_1944301 [Mycena galopus ATCC 62051]